MNRRFLAGAAVVVWLGALGWLVYREYGRPRAARLAQAALSLPPSANYYSLDLGGTQIGYASNTVDTLADTLRVTDYLALEIPVLGTVQRTEARTEAVLSRALKLRNFTAVVRGEQTRFDAHGRVLGDSVLAVSMVTADDSQELRLPLTTPITLTSMLPIDLAFGGELKPGRSYAMRVFDPVQMAERDVALKVEAESTFVIPDSAVFDSTNRRWVPATYDTVRAWRVRESRGEVPVETWIDRLGQIVLARSPMGFTMRRSAYELAYENFRRARRDSIPRAATLGADIIRQTAIQSNVRLQPKAIERLTVQLQGIGFDRFDLNGAGQTLRGDTLVIARPDSTFRAGYRLPAGGPTLGPYLRPEPLVQSTDPRIQAQARQIVGRTHNPVRAARLLNEWVYGHIEKKITLSVPSAVEVLTSRRGDCNEHTVLYVALARAVGLPARTAAGLVYLDGAFYYHAWPEVYLGRWVPVDPTFGEFPADAAHIRFTIGGLARQVELVRLIGRLAIHVLPTTS